MAKKKSTAVGYGNPPVHTRFQKGASGNRNGRPKGSSNGLDAFEKMLAKRVKLSTPNGRKRTVTMRDALFLQLGKKALDGDVPAIKVVLDLMELANEVAENKQDRLTIVLSGSDALL